jgi:hypothetical protein
MRSDHEDLIRASACTVAGKLNAGEVTPLDLLDALEARIPPASQPRLSIPSKTPSPSSRRCSVGLPPAPTTNSGTPLPRPIETFSPSECANYFAAAGYDADRSENALESWVASVLSNPKFAKEDAAK